MSGLISDLRLKPANGPISTVLGWFFLVAITLAALAAIPLFLLTHGGRFAPCESPQAAKRP